MLEKIPESIGQRFLRQRAGIEATVFYRLGRPDLPRIDVQSAAFPAGGSIPVQYTADGIGCSPPLRWHGVASTTASLVLIVEDADSPTPHPLVHAIVVNMSVDDAQLPEGAINSPDHEGFPLQVGRNSYLTRAWLPPDPPPGHGEHRYVFQVFALLAAEPFSEAPGRQEIFDAVQARGLAGGYLIGKYCREKRVGVNAENEAPAEVEEPIKTVAVGAPA